MNNCHVLGILLTVLIIIILFLYVTSNKKNIEKWENINFNSYLPILSNNQRSELDIDINKANRTNYTNGFTPLKI